MSTSVQMDRRKLVLLKRVAAPPPWEAAVLPLSVFPAPESEMVPVRGFLQQMCASFAEHATGLETFVQFANLHLADGASRLGKNGREWMPMMGLGVWPDRDPPANWSQEELKDLGPEDKVRQLMNIVLRVTGSAEARTHACDTMLGLGTVLQFFLTKDSQRFLAAAKDLLLPPIKDSSFTGFPIYVPLVEARSITAASAEQLDHWLCGADTLLRESPEDGGVLILSKHLEYALGRIEPDQWEVRWNPHVAAI